MIVHERTPPTVNIPSLSEMPDPGRGKASTQVAFGKILNDLAREETDFVSRIVTTSPDVTVSTNLGGFVNRKGLFSRSASEDVFRKRKIASPQIWAHTPKGQHIELGIAENNLFLMLAALGLSKDLFDQRIFPIGTVYDPFIARGLDALNYACYQDARFILAATPSGLTLGPEGGAHQSISSPLIGMLSFALYYLLKNPDILKRAYQEADEVLGRDVSIPPSMAQIGQLKYIRAVLLEALRLWPTAPAFGVAPFEDEIIGGKYPLPKGTFINVLGLSLHRDKTVWGDDPDLFNPENFMPSSPTLLPHPGEGGALGAPTAQKKEHKKARTNARAFESLR